MSDEFYYGPGRSIRPVHTDWPRREVDAVLLEDVGAQLESYVARTAALDNALRSLPGSTPLGVVGSQWSISLWEKTATRRERFVFSNGWPTGFRVRDVYLAPAFAGNRQGVFWAEGGLPLSRLNHELHLRGLSLPTFGTNNGQTAAGIISTGAHGSGFDFGAIHEAVRGLHLKFGPGPRQDVYLEGNTAVVDDAFVKDRLQVGRVVRDQALFDAAVVGLGSFGVIRGVVFESEPLFEFERFNLWYPWNDAFRNALATVDFSGFPVPRPLSRIDQYQGADKPAGTVSDLIDGRLLHHIEIFFNPNGPDDRKVQLNLMVKDWTRQTHLEFKRPLPTHFNFSSAFLGVMTSLMASGVVPTAITKALLNSQIDDRFKEGWYRGTIRSLFRGEVFEGPVVNSGISIGVDRAVEAIDLIDGYYKSAYLDEGKTLPVVLAQRFVKCGNAKMAFARVRADPGAGHPFPNTTCVLEIDGAGTPEVRRFLEESLCVLDHHGIDFALHWGKMLSYLTLTDVEYGERSTASVGQVIPRRTVAAMYGPALQEWRAQREALLPATARRRFTSPYLQKIGVLP